MRRLLPIFCVLGAILGGCSPSSLRTKKPDNAVLNHSMTAMWAQDIRKQARTGDWILSRSYSTVGDAIVVATRGESFSHAVLYDAERDTIIEAIRPVVREVPLEDFLARNRYVVVVRPDDQNSAQGRLAIQRARTAVGASFDYTGMLGIDNSSRFYCSELVAWASQVEDQPIIVTPADLYKFGEPIYSSGAREDVQIQTASIRREASMGVTTNSVLAVGE